MWSIYFAQLCQKLETTPLKLSDQAGEYHYQRETCQFIDKMALYYWNPFRITHVFPEGQVRIHPIVISV